MFIFRRWPGGDHPQRFQSLRSWGKRDIKERLVSNYLVLCFWMGWMNVRSAHHSRSSLQCNRDVDDPGGQVLSRRGQSSTSDNVRVWIKDNSLLKNIFFFFSCTPTDGTDVCGIPARCSRKPGLQQPGPHHHTWWRERPRIEPLFLRIFSGHLKPVAHVCAELCARSHRLQQKYKAIIKCFNFHLSFFELHNCVLMY